MFVFVIGEGGGGIVGNYCPGAGYNINLLPGNLCAWIGRCMYILHCKYFMYRLHIFMNITSKTNIIVYCCNYNNQ